MYLQQSECLTVDRKGPWNKGKLTGQTVNFEINEHTRQAVDTLLSGRKG